MTMKIIICGFCNILRDLRKLQFNSALFLLQYLKHKLGDMRRCFNGRDTVAAEV